MDGLAEGRHATTAPLRRHADLWRQIWDALEDFGAEHVKVVKVASHKSLSSVQSGAAGMTFQEWAGNKAADHAAKRGAWIHPPVADIAENLQESWKTAQVFGRWI
eukprot:12185267-Karenia_brevis.AAC.1